MLVPFVLMPASLAPHHAASESRRLLDHERFLEAWESFGILVEPTTGAGAMQQAIEGLPLRLRKLWQAAYTRFRRVQVNWSGVDESNPEDALRRRPRNVSLACVTAEVTLQLGLGPEDALGLLPGLELEVAILEASDRSEAFKRARATANEPIEAGTPRDQIWEERFRSLVEVSRHGVIVDRYAGLNMVERRDRQDGLRAFFARVAQCETRLKTLRIYTTFSPQGPGYAELTRLMTSAWRATAELEVCMVEDASFKRLAHDRFLRFDNTVIELDTGLEVMSGVRAFRRCPFSFRACRESDRNVERALFAETPSEHYSRYRTG